MDHCYIPCSNPLHPTFGNVHTQTRSFVTQNIQSNDPNLGKEAIRTYKVKHRSNDTFRGSLRDKKIQTFFIITTGFLLGIEQML